MDSFQLEEPETSAKQQAARHNVPKDLPVFSGDPAGWSLCISSFDSTTKLCGFSNWEKMIRLQKSLQGPAFQTVRSILSMAEMVPLVNNTLRNRFGQPKHIIDCLIEKVRRMPAPRIARPESIIQFSEAVQGMLAHMQVARQYAHLTNPTLLDELLSKLPIERQYIYAHDTRGTTNRIWLHTFGTFMEELGKDAARLVVMDCSSVTTGEKNISHRGHVHAHSEELNPTTSWNTSYTCVICNKGDHDAKKYFTETQEGVHCRCVFSCLDKLNWQTCKDRPRCDINGCTYRHHTLLHDDQEHRKHSTNSLWKDEHTARSNVAENHHHKTSMAATSLLRIVPVTLYGPKSNATTFAFLDERSSMTLIHEDLVEQHHKNGKEFTAGVSQGGSSRFGKAIRNERRPDGTTTKSTTAIMYTMRKLETFEGIVNFRIEGNPTKIVNRYPLRHEKDGTVNPLERKPDWGGVCMENRQLCQLRMNLGFALDHARQHLSS
uniref:Uncharacterized protein n=1 Tax=Anopheles stephensi TaxID=30069 RepID=A0A182YPS1_ANOST